MKRIAATWMIIVFTVVLCATAAQSQSLPPGERSSDLGKKNPHHSTKAIKVYENDNLPSAATLSVVGTSTKEMGRDSNSLGNNHGQGNTPEFQNTTDNSNRQNHKSEEIKPGQSPGERQQAYAEWGKRIRDERKNVNQLAWELDDLKRNPPMSVAVFHLWPDDQLYLESITEKQKALDRARAALSDLEDQARRVGVPSSFIGDDGSSPPRESHGEGTKTYANVILKQQVRKAKASSHENEADEDGNDAGQNPVTPNVSASDDPKQDDKKGEIKPGQSPDERQKAYVYWQKRVQQREDRIDQLTRAGHIPERIFADTRLHYCAFLCLAHTVR
jgi:hypothetical protein